MRDVAKLSVFAIVVLVLTYFLVVKPSMDCYAVNGTPVRGLLMVECVQ